MNIFMTQIMITWTLGLCIVCLIHHLIVSDFIYNKTGIRTYYYRIESKHAKDDVNTQPLLMNYMTNDKAHMQEHLFTDISWIVLAGITLPLVIFMMLLPLILTGNVPLFFYMPLMLCLFNAFVILMRKRLNSYDELSEFESPYRHRYIPLSLFLGMILSITIFIVFLPYDALFNMGMHLPVMLILLLLILLDMMVLFMDKFNERKSVDLRRDDEFKKILFIFLLIIAACIIFVFGYYWIGTNQIFSYSDYVDSYNKILEYGF